MPTFTVKAFGTGTRAQTGPTTLASLSASRYTQARFQHIATCDCDGIRLVYSGFNGVNSTGSGLGTYTIRDGLEKDGVFTPVLFSGSRDGTVAPGTFLISDTVSVPLTAGDTFYTRPRSFETNGLQPIVRQGIAAYDEGTEWYTSGAPQDKTLAGTITGSVIAATPTLILPVNPTGRQHKTMLLIGDSIASGQGADPLNGFLTQAMRSSTPHVPYVHASQGSTQSSDGAASTDPGDHLTVLAEACDGLVCNYGVNDLRGGRTIAAIQADLIKIWGLLPGEAWQCTITPESTSSDGWTTTGGQTTSGINTNRAALNTWLRAGAPMNAGAAVATGTPGALLAGQNGHPLRGVFDTSTTVETTTDSGIWKANHTADGLHPSLTGHTAMAAAVPPTSLTITTGGGGNARLASRRAVLAAT